MTRKQNKKLKGIRRKNRLYALLFILIGTLSIFIEYDITFFVFTLFIGIPMFFSKKNMMNWVLTRTLFILF